MYYNKLSVQKYLFCIFLKFHKNINLSMKRPYVKVMEIFTIDLSIQSLLSASSVLPKPLR